MAENREKKIHLPPPGPPSSPNWAWVGPFSILFGLVPIIVPEFTAQKTPWWLRISVGVLIVVLVIAFPYLHAFISKARAYDRLHAICDNTRSELEGARNTIRGLLSDTDAYELLQVQYHREELFVKIKKKRGPQFPIGTRFAVCDTSDFSVMGTFSIVNAN